MQVAILSDVHDNIWKLAEVLDTGNKEIELPPELCERAFTPIKRLLDFADTRGRDIYGENDA